ITIVDYNKLQGVGFTKDILDLEPFKSKWTDFGWEAVSLNGNSFEELLPTLNSLPFKKNKPSVIIANTIKGLGGVEKYINKVSSQYKPPTEEELNKALKGLE